jgi:CheY-like chemotaxis protein
MIFEDKLETVLVIDDEPFQTEWLTDYFKARGFEVVQAEDLQSALDALEKTRYRYVVIDLSIPVSPALAQPLAALGPEFFKYPGLMAARKARSTGHNSFQVIVYSVHDSDDVNSYTDLIVCRYILKGRPRELKLHIEDTIKREPHGWRSLSKRPVPTGPATRKSPRQKPAPKNKDRSC